MKRIYVSTVGRGKQKEESSKIYCIDTDIGQILSQVKLPLSMLDLGNPRGGCRGCRGLTFHNNDLYAAGFDGLFQIDPNDMFIIKGQWFKNIRDIHQIYSTKNNGIKMVASFTNEIFYTKSTERQDYSCVHSGLPAPEWFPGCRDTLHLNSISKNYGLCAKAAIIFNLKTKEILLENQEYLRGSHDIWELPWGEVAINNSKQCRTITFDPKTWELKRILYQETQTKGGSELAKRGWVRGMYYLPEKDIMFIGSSPAEVIILHNVNTSLPLQQRIPISDEIVEATFDVIPHPTDWI